MSWPRVFLKVRRALLETNWDDCIAGVKRYAKYCQEAGIEGSAFVITPARFFEDEIYLEALTFAPAEDPKVAEHKRKEAERRDRAVVSGRALQPPVEPYPLESVAAYETRIMLAKNDRGRSDPAMGGGMAINARIASLANRMRIAK